MNCGWKMCAKRYGFILLFLTLLLEGIRCSQVRDCSKDCWQEEHNPVCGTDGTTYSSECDLESARCKGHEVTLKHRGKCPERTRCWDQRAYAQKVSKDHKMGTFIPECMDDGRFQEVQCHRGTGYCWCVSETGKVIPGSALQYRRPSCARNNKATRSSGTRDRRKKGCTPTDRSAFNNHLIKIFMTEYQRILQPTTEKASVESVVSNLDQTVLEWKFRELDGNHDGILRRKEYRDLRRLAKKFVKPRRCAKSLMRYCDSDNNEVLTIEEWKNCLAVDNISFRLFLSLHSEEHLSGHGGGHDQGSPSSFSLLRRPPPPPLHGGGGGGGGGGRGGGGGGRGGRRGGRGGGGGGGEADALGLKSSPSTQLHDSNPDEEDHEDDTDSTRNNCASERDSALETQRESPEGEELYIPSCTIDGQYERVQCYQGYCWCTEKETGKPIPGTSVNGSKPDCSHASPAQPNKSIKGCKGKKKERFLEELMDIFTKNMVKAAQNDSITEPDPEQTIEERAARWEFNLLDKNENRMLDRKEWKIFRRWVSEFRGLRRCGRKLPRFCDVDGDRKISLDEWLACLEAKPDDKKTRKKKPWRKGQNPFQTILKSDRK